jgi:peptidoglycan/LPS O-acetylase OafA/YrhL
MALNSPKRPGIRFGSVRIPRRYLIAAAVLALVNVLAVFFIRDGWDSTAVGRFVLPILGQALLIILAVAAVAALVAAIKVFLVRRDG